MSDGDDAGDADGGCARWSSPDNERLYRADEDLEEGEKETSGTGEGPRLKQEPSIRGRH